MSDQFKFLSKYDANSSASGQEDAAQSFLDDKLSKNRYTIKQQETLDANGGSKKFGSEYNKVITNQDEIDGFNANPLGDYATLNADMNDKFKSGQWGHGSNSKEDLANKYGLDINAQANNGETAVWGTDRQGKNVFLGNANNDIRGNTDVLKAHGAQADAGEVNHSSIGESEVGSNGDVIGAMLNLWDGGNADPGKAPEEKTDLVKIEHSPEIKQAKERVQTYENDILSGKTSEDIYQTGSNEKYSFDATKGAAGIGTLMDSSSKEQADKATASFLDNKKSQVKDQYQFTAA
tara:strand:- start:1590 stop:2465 length:876 start_codon:yes stop_codon:yes gene_type:complete